VKELEKYIPLIITALLGLIEITPIKLNPISAFIRWLGKNFNYHSDKQAVEQLKSLTQDISTLRTEIDKLNLKVDGNEIDRVRQTILDFADALRHGDKFSREKFHSIVDLNKKYHDIITEHGFTNGVIDNDYKYIEMKYQECLKDNSFLN
jgi:hypothetical protein